jgi:hypothetical protein
MPVPAAKRADDILAALHEAPRTARELSALFHVSHGTLLWSINRLLDEGKIHRKPEPCRQGTQFRHYPGPEPRPAISATRPPSSIWDWAQSFGGQDELQTR